MRSIWYDEAIEEYPDERGWFDIERVYLLDWNRFTPADWVRLNGIWPRLPSCRDISTNSLPRWFCDIDDPRHGYLWASVEPHGLQVAGSLKGKDWEQWHTDFVNHLAGFPIRMDL
jgi:hypothetical protein